MEASISCSGWYRAAHTPGQARLLIAFPPAGAEQVAWKKIIVKRRPRDTREQDEAQGSWGTADNGLTYSTKSLSKVDTRF